MASTSQTKLIDTRQIINNSDVSLPNAIDVANQGIDSFQWDDRQWPDNDEIRSTSHIPSLWDPSRANIDDEMFQSGIGYGDDLKMKQIVLERYNDSNQWLPMIKHGFYYTTHKERYLYSSESIIATIDSADNLATGEGSNPTANTYTYPFELKPFVGIASYIYRRGYESGSEPLLHKKIRQRKTFTGEIDGNGDYLDTVDGNGDVIWANVNILYDEFIVDSDNSQLIYNKDYIERIGIIAATPADVLDCELIGESSAVSGMIFSSEYFPALETSGRVYVHNPVDATYVEWTIVNDITGTVDLGGGPIQIDETHEVVQFDYDTGILSFGDGVTYGAIPPLLHNIYMTYEITPRVEYEPKESTDYKISDLDVNPLRLGTNRGFVYLAESDDFLHRIEVAANKPELGANLYGPVYIGGDYSVITATAFNSAGQTIPNIPLTFSLASTEIGFLNGVKSAVIVNTDYQGRAYIQYNSESNLDAVSQTTSDLTTVGGSPVLTLDEAVSGFSDLTDIYTFQLVDDDEHQPFYRRVILYEYDANAVNPNDYQTWLENGSPNEAIFDDQHEYYFKTGGNVPVHPVNINGTEVTYDSGVTIPPIAGDIIGYKVTVGKEVTIRTQGTNDLHRHQVYGDDVSLKIGLPPHMTGAHIDALNHFVYYGFRFADENHNAASTIGTATFLTIN